MTLKVTSKSVLKAVSEIIYSIVNACDGNNAVLSNTNQTGERTIDDVREIQCT